MRKIFRNIFFSAVALASVAACVDDRNNFMVDDSFGFNNAIDENVTELAIYGGSYELAVIKSGKGFTDATVSVEGSNAALLAYNKEKGTGYIPVPKEFYSFSTSVLDYKAEEVSKTVTVTWDVAEIAAEMAREPENEYVIPVALKSDDLEVNEGRHLVILNLKRSTLSLGVEVVAKGVSLEAEAPVKEVVNVEVVMDREIGGADVTAEFTIDNDAIAAYNNEYKVNYLPAPEGLFVLGDAPIIKSGDKLAHLSVELNTSVLFKDGVVEPFEGYVLPVRLVSNNVEGVGINEEKNLTYLVLSAIKPDKGLFTRVWGKYSSSAAWNEAFGSLKGADRSIACDGEYIYMPESAVGVTKLWKISVADGTVSEVPTSTVNNKGTFTLSCARILPNNDPAVNNGKDVLVVSNLYETTETDAYLYVYDNGTDKEPSLSLLKMSQMSRRLGDKFTVYGTYQIPYIYFKDQATGAFMLWTSANKPVAEWWPDRNQLYMDETSFGGLYFYPGSECNTALFTSTESTYSFTTRDPEVVTNNKPTYVQNDWTTDPELANCHGFQFFELAGKKYIAYVQLLDGTHSNLVVIEDEIGTPEGFKTVLETKKVVYTAPIQNEFENVASPHPASNSAVDCSVHVSDEGVVHIAVLQQCGGLSLFKSN